VFHSSVTVKLPGFPPKIKADVLFAPAPAALYLAAPVKDATVVQAVPFHDSAAVVFSVGEAPSPVAAIADVEVPAPAALCLAVFKSATSVQLVPFHNSVSALLRPGPSPPKTKPAVCVLPASPVCAFA